MNRQIKNLETLLSSAEGDREIAIRNERAALRNECAALRNERAALINRLTSKENILQAQTGACIIYHQ